MPTRYIKDSICSSDTLAGISAEAERLWWRIVVRADDFGRFEARPEVLRGQCLTALMDAVNNEDIERWLVELETATLLRRYTVAGKPYLVITTWRDHQQVRAKKSKYPTPAGICQQPSTDDNARRHTHTDSLEHELEYEYENEHESDSPLRPVLEFWQAKAGLVDPTNYEYLKAFVTEDGLSVDLLLWACEKALERKVPRLKYVVGILKNCRDSGIRTRAAAENGHQRNKHSSFNVPSQITAAEYMASLKEAK